MLGKASGARLWGSGVVVGSKGVMGPDSVGEGPWRVGHVGAGVGDDRASELFFTTDQRKASL